ncbi:MAG: tetratricopeptide repeat protein, partial [Planctomycetota bacterium]
MSDAHSATPSDSVEALVAEAIERGLSADVLAELAARAPEHAAALRARLARLEQLGLLGPLAHPEQTDFGARYRLLGRLGRGGMGVVYLAFDRTSGGQVALKVCEAASGRASERFRREIEQHTRLRHPGLVAVLDAGAVDGVPYFAMEYVDGEGLDAKLARLRATPVAPAARPAEQLLPGHARGYVEAACRIAVELARTLAHVHAHGVVHRDVKPANVLVARDGRVLLLDLGLAHLVDAPALTRTGDLAGTPAYMAPEQVAGSPSALDARVDVYALCALLYELLALQPPFAATGGASAARVLHAIQHQEPAPLCARVPELPRALETIVHQGLAKAPRERYASATELADDLERFLAFAPIRAKPPSAARRALRWSKRRPAAALAIAFGSTLLVAAPLALYKYGRDVSAERDRARHAATAARAEAQWNLEATRFLEGLFQRLAESGDAAAAALALDALQQGIRDLEGGVLLSDATRARLFEAVARVYHGLARTAEAVPLYDRALAFRQRALGEAHPETIASL